MEPTEPQERPLFHFLQINDLHVQADEPAMPAENRTYERANDKARWLIDAINTERFCPPPDFVVGIGDLINGGEIARLAPDLQYLQELLQPLRCPFYPLVGNHEVIQQERSAEHLRAYQAAFGEERADYTFSHGGIVFIALNNSGAPAAEPAKERNVWLKSVLEATREQPKIILCHVPLVPVREATTLAQSFGFSSDYDHDAGTLRLMEEHATTVIAVLSGHLHLTGVKQQAGIYHIVASGTASYPSDAAVLYEAFRDRIEVTVLELPPDLASTAPTLHGIPRYAHDFTDAEHPTPEEYQRGRADERQFTIPL